MANSSVFPLALLYIDNQGIEGATKFQKLVFLAQKEGNLPKGVHFDFKGDKYGPFSPKLQGTLQELENQGLIETEERQNRSGNTIRNYRLTDLGHQVMREALASEPNKFEPIFNEAEKIKKTHGEKSLDRLLRYVYNKYPELTKESELEEYVRT